MRGFASVGRRLSAAADLRRLPAMAAGIAGLVGGAALGRSCVHVPSGSEVQAVAFSIDLQGDQFPASVPLAVSVDGSRIAYGAVRNGHKRLFVRLVDRDDEVELAGTDDGEQPAFSPEGQEVAFAADGKLKRTLITGGAPTVLCDLPSPRGIAWGMDGYIFFAPEPSSGLFRVRRSGGAPEPVTRVDNRSDDHSHRWPFALPGGVLLFVAMHGTPATAQVIAQSLETGEQEIVAADGWKAQYLNSGHLVYANHAGEVFVAPFDRLRLAVTGRAFRRPERPTTSLTTGEVSFSASAGTLAYVPVEAPRRLRIVVNWHKELKSDATLTSQ
jgi:hypothetical protein